MTIAMARPRSKETYLALPYLCQPNGNGAYGDPNVSPKVIKIDITYEYEIVIVRNAVARLRSDVVPVLEMAVGRSIYFFGSVSCRR